MRSLLLIVFAAFVVTASGCGSITGITPTKPHTLSELSAYDRVIVTDFTDETVAFSEPEKVKIACKDFADKIATQLKAAQTFSEISREPSSGRAILLTGTIRYMQEKGNTVTKMLGEGLSMLYAEVIFKDNESGNELATLEVGKEDWGLGGVISATQSVEGYMDEAAKKISHELKVIKTGNVDIAQR